MQIKSLWSSWRAEQPIKGREGCSAVWIPTRAAAPWAAQGWAKGVELSMTVWRKSGLAPQRFANQEGERKAGIWISNLPRSNFRLLFACNVHLKLLLPIWSALQGGSGPAVCCCTRSCPSQPIPVYSRSPWEQPGQEHPADGRGSRVFGSRSLCPFPL